MDYKFIGKKIMLARKEAGLLQKELGDKLKLNQATISCYEKGVLTIEMETIGKIARILGKPIAYFYGDEYTKTPNLISLDEVTIPIFTEIPNSFPHFESSEVKGYQRHPKHMYPRADFVLKNPTNIAQEPDDAGDYYYFNMEREAKNGKAMLLRLDSKFYIQRVTVKKNNIEVHSIKQRQHLINPPNIDFLAELLMVTKEIN